MDFQRACYRQQLYATEDSSESGSRYGLRRVGVGIEAQVADLFKQGASIGGFVLKSAYIGRIERRLYLKSKSPRLVKRGLISKPKSYLIEVEKTQRGRAQLRELSVPLALRIKVV